MDEHLHYFNLLQYIKRNPHDFGLLLLHNPKGVGILEQLVEVQRTAPAMQELIWTPLPPAFLNMVACQLQILMAQESGEFSIHTSEMTSEGRQVQLRSGTHYQNSLSLEDIRLLHDWCHQILNPEL